MPELLLEPVWSWPLALLAAAALIGVVLATYPQRVAHLPPIWRRTLIALRLLTALVLIFALLRPALRYSDVDKQAAQVIVLTDASQSMTTADGPAGLTRRAAVLKTLESAASQLEKLSEQAEVRHFDFSAQVVPVDQPAITAEGRQTAIGQALDELRRDDTGKRLAAIFLFSDGAQRTLGDDAIDPLTAARRFAEQRGVPIHTFTYGSSELTGAGLDLAIEDVVVDQLAYEKKTVPIRFQLRSNGAGGRKVKTRLLIERITGLGDTAKSEMVELPCTSDAKPFEEVEITGNRGLQTGELSFVAEQAGEFKLAVEVVPEEGEIKLANNRYETVITVRKGGLKVAYFDVARSVEQKFIRRLNENARIQLDVFLVPGGQYLEQARIDPELFQPGRYDVYVIGDVPAFVFSQGGTDLLQSLLERCRDPRQGSGLAMLGGSFNYGAGGYATSPIAPLLPVQMSPAERMEVGQDPPPGQFLAGPVQMLPAPDGQRHYLMQLGANSDQTWRQLAPLKAGANKLVPKNASVNVLAMTPQREPLLLGWDTGFNRVLALGVSDTWRWWTHGNQAAHQRFWEQLLLWLAHMENESDQPVWVRVEPRNVAPGDRVTATFGAQDEQQQPIADATYTVEVIGPDGKPRTVPAQKVGDENTAEITDAIEPGDYQVLVTATRAGSGHRLAGAD